MEWLSKLLDGEVVQKIVAVMVMVNVALAATSKILEKVKLAFGSEGAGKVAVVVSKIAGVLQKIVDFSVGNPEHKKVEAKVEEKK